VSNGDAALDLKKASDALAAFDVDAAVKLLESRASKGPYDHVLLVKLHEQLGIAYAYLKNEKQALAAFRTLLALEPGHLLSYTLSPQATFLFERARKESESNAPAHLEVSWPQGLKENEAIPLNIEVISDPMSMLHSMALYVRDREEGRYRRLQIDLPKAGEVGHVTLPAPHTKRDSILELYGSAYDAEGNEVLLWFNAQRPRELPLGYEAPSPWYRKWWVWAAVGGVTAVGTGTTVYLLGIEPGKTVGGGVSLGG